uniref:Uncharacterized protein n=1 Tax=Anguilla anguilla TaxID=7936 RepID=A0A0E9TWV8_ANGAN
MCITLILVLTANSFQLVGAFIMLDISQLAEIKNPY